MNGGFPRAYFSFGAPPLPLYPGTDWKRLGAALTISCVLHATLVVAPYFGASTPPDLRLAPRSAQKPAPARVLDLRLEQARAQEPAPAPNRARGANRLPIPAPAYYRTDELTRPPRPTSVPQLDVPRSVARSVSGKVVLRLWISERGNVEAVEVESSNLPETVSGTAADAFRKIRFVPGEIDGRRVRTLMTIEVAYGKRPPP
jgi:TonB family protein